MKYFKISFHPLTFSIETKKYFLISLFFCSLSRIYHSIQVISSFIVYCILKKLRKREENSQHAPLIPNQFLLLSSLEMRMMEEREHIARRLLKFARIPSKIFTQFALTFLYEHSFYLRSTSCFLFGRS